MARWEPGTRERLARAALELFTTRGFEQTTAAEIAAAVGVTERTFFRHFADKREVLFDGQERYRQAFLDGAATAPPGATPRLRCFVGHHLSYHIERRQEVFIANFELRALSPANYRTIVTQRRAYEARLITLLNDGVASGDFDIADTRVAAYAILAMLTGACTWYRPEGRLSKSDVLDLYTDLVLHGCLTQPLRARNADRANVLPPQP